MIQSQPEDVGSMMAHDGRCAAVVAAADAAIIGADEHERVVVFNPAAERMLGRSAQDVLGTAVGGLFADDAWSRRRALLPGAAAPQERDELVYALRDGTRFPVELSLTFSSGAGLRYVLVLREVSDRLEEAAEDARLVRALDEERARLESVVEAAPIGIVVYDSSGAIMFNEHAQELLEVELRGGPAAYCHVIRGADGAPLALEQLPSQRALRGESVFGEELTLAPPSGQRRRILGSAVPVRGPGGGIIGAVSVFDDVSVLRRREDEQRFLARAGELLAGSSDYRRSLDQLVHFIVPHLADGCIALSLEENRLVPSAWTCTEAARARTLDELLRDPRAAMEQVGALTPRSDRPELRGPSALPSADGRERLFCERIGVREYLVVPLRARGHVVGAMTMFNAASGRRLGEPELALTAELARLAAQAIDGARLYEAEQRATHARDAMLGIVAHDLRNPLQSIKMLSSMLDRDTKDPAVAQRLQVIQRAAGRMNRLIQDLLDVAKLESGHFGLECTPVPAAELAAEAVEWAQPILDGRRLALAAESALPAVEVDRDRMLQVFSNLLGNAVKFTSRTGVIRIAARSAAGEVVFSVSDDGPGIPAEHLTHIFDRFYQGMASDRRGAGLGLAICRGIVAAHGGHIWAQSEPGAGTTVFFALPVR